MQPSNEQISIKPRDFDSEQVNAATISAEQVALRQAQQLLRQQRVDEAHSRLKQIKGNLEMLKAGAHPDAHESFDEAIKHCNDSISSIHEESHDHADASIGHAVTGLEKAMSHHRSQPPQSGRHHAHPQIQHIIEGGQNEHLIH